jgi:hypothetical protein
MKKKNSRMLQGGTTQVYKDRLGWFEKRTDIEKDRYDDTIFVIEKKYEYKPWLVAKILLGREDLDWIILQYNDIVDIMEEFVAGRTIRVPSKARVDFSITTKPTINATI